MRVNGALARGLAGLVLTATALALGYFGLRAYVLTPEAAAIPMGRSFLDIAFADL
jgi:hypothetical protein